MLIVKTTKSHGSTGNISGRKTRNSAWFVRDPIHLRRRHRVFSRPRFLRGEVLSEAGVKDITWITPSGEGGGDRGLEKPGGAVARVCPERSGRRVLHSGRSARHRRKPRVMMNAYREDLDFDFQSLASPMSWEALVDTSEPTGRVAGARRYEAGEIYRLQAHSFALFIDRATRRHCRQVSRHSIRAILLEDDRAGPSSGRISLDMNGRAALLQLAGLLGIPAHYTDALGQTHEVSDETSLALTAAFGSPPYPTLARQELGDREQKCTTGAWSGAPCPCRGDLSPGALALRLPAGCRGNRLGVPARRRRRASRST